jgi:transcriptional regulator with XRE-family HTH domain
MNIKKGPTEVYIQENREAIGTQIRVFREKKGLSQDELSEIMGVNRSTISKVENGKFAITVDYLVKFAWYLDFTISMLEKQDK